MFQSLTHVTKTEVGLQGDGKGKKQKKEKQNKTKKAWKQRKARTSYLVVFFPFFSFHKVEYKFRLSHQN